MDQIHIFEHLVKIGEEKKDRKFSKVEGRVVAFGDYTYGMHTIRILYKCFCYNKNDKITQYVVTRFFFIISWQSLHC